MLSCIRNKATSIREEMLLVGNEKHVNHLPTYVVQWNAKIFCMKQTRGFEMTRKGT
jgi:hypothetical protein